MAAFRELSVENRIKTLQNEGAINDTEAAFLLKQFAESSDTTISADVANHMIEHQIGKYTLPVGVVRGLIVNGEVCDVLVATEEPSVIAAACNGARIAAATDVGYGIIARSPQYVTTAQIAFEDADGSVAARLSRIVEDKEKVAELLRIANASHPSISKRGGGARKCRASALHGFAKLEIDVDTCDAMGANTVNTMGEAVKAQLESWLGVQALVAILTNTSRVASTAEVHIPVEALASRRLEDSEREREGKRLARRIAALSALAASDPARAATHNKGILNGIAGAALASGNDTRALESAAHAWAARSGRYLPLSKWNTETLNGKTILHGSIEIPLQIGIVGGSISSLPMAKLAIKIGKYKNANDFRNTLAALGLVQNLAALRALAGPGIQAGHMALQSSNLAIAAGAKGAEIAEITHNILQLSPAERTTEKVTQLLQKLRESSKN
ncbi:hydroxymethylglutaryl-CoA reductase, degradative [Gardnerella swidsinskii]|uniref:hydroxymethylglutaryl-CoA reductase, degradative n=1 Tax=Gardnerella swidsinskii TaxID=2792979 RepID=UPI0039F078D7